MLCMCMRLVLVSIWLVAWCSGNSTPGPVSTWMGDCLQAGKPSQCVTSRPGPVGPKEVSGCPALVLYSSDEPGELSQWLFHSDSTINIVIHYYHSCYY